MENPCAVFEDYSEIFEVADPELGFSEFECKAEDEDEDESVNWSLLCIAIGLPVLVIIVCGLAVYFADKHHWSTQGVNIVFHVRLPDPIRGF